MVHICRHVFYAILMEEETTLEFNGIKSSEKWLLVSVEVYERLCIISSVYFENWHDGFHYNQSNIKEASCSNTASLSIRLDWNEGLSLLSLEFCKESINHILVLNIKCNPSENKLHVHSHQPNGFCTSYNFENCSVFFFSSAKWGYNYTAFDPNKLLIQQLDDSMDSLVKAMTFVMNDIIFVSNHHKIVYFLSASI